MQCEQFFCRYGRDAINEEASDTLVTQLGVIEARFENRFQPARSAFPKLLHIRVLLA